MEETTTPPQAALVAVVTVLLLVPPAVSAVAGPGNTAPSASEDTLELETAAAEATIDLSVPGGVPIELSPLDGPNLLAGAGQGVGVKLEGLQLPQGPWSLASVDRDQPGPGAATATWVLGPEQAPVLELERTFTLRDDGAGLTIESDLTAHTPVYVTDYRLVGLVLEESFAGEANLTAHDYHGGADWRDVFHLSRDASAPQILDHVPLPGQSWEIRYHDGLAYNTNTARGVDVFGFTG